MKIRRKCLFCICCGELLDMMSRSYSVERMEKLIIDLLTEWKEKHAAEEAK